jgi:hypothetical protein
MMTRDHERGVGCERVPVIRAHALQLGGNLTMATIFEAGRDFWVALVGIILFGGWIIPAVTAIIAKNWRKARESEQLAVLKQSMIERGMSVEEMERVIDLGKGSKGGCDKAS